MDVVSDNAVRFLFVHQNIKVHVFRPHPQNKGNNIKQFCTMESSFKSNEKGMYALVTPLVLSTAGVRISRKLKSIVFSYKIFAYLNKNGCLGIQQVRVERRKGRGGYLIFNTLTYLQFDGASLFNI